MRILKAIFGGIAKVIGYLMVTLGLWLPSLFTVAFFITCAATNTVLSKGIMAVFYCGLGFTAVGGLAIAMWRHKRLKQKASKRQKAKKAQPEKTAPSASYGGTDDRRQASYGRTDEREPVSYARTVEREPVSYGRTDERGQASYGKTDERENGYYARTVEREPTSYGRSERRDYSDLDRKYFGGEAPKSSERDTRSYDGDSALDADALWRRLSGADVPDEQPLMFRTRTDPDVYIYEYSDRYQYWRRTKAGMMLERTEFKKPEELRGSDKVRKQ